MQLLLLLLLALLLGGVSSFLLYYFSVASSLCFFFVLTLSCPVGVPVLQGGCFSLHSSTIAPRCMPALAPWITRPDVVVIFLRVTATKHTQKEIQRELCEKSASCNNNKSQKVSMDLGERETGENARNCKFLKLLLLLPHNCCMLCGVIMSACVCVCVFSCVQINQKS